MNRLGGLVLGAIECHQQLVRKHPKVGQQAVLIEALKDLKIHPIEVTRQAWIEQVADLIVTGWIGKINGILHGSPQAYRPLG